MGKYSEDTEWDDVTPFPQDDGPSPNPLAAINYTEEYAEAMAYLRASIAANDLSLRLMGLTQDIISMNPAHYTVWLYRAKVVFHNKLDLNDELQWVNETAFKNLKNYQIWHHRQMILEKMNAVAEGEASFIEQMLEKDNKNYHVWSYRQWLVKRFGIWNDQELSWTESMIDDDVRNNSAWNHRWFLVFGREEGKAPEKAVVDRELSYTQSKIRLAPQNQSPWNYLRGLLKQVKLSVASQKEFAFEFASLDKPDDVHSSHALDLLADIYAEDKDQKEQAKQALELLAQRYDPIRANYWNYRKSLLEQPSATA